MTQALNGIARLKPAARIIDRQVLSSVLDMNRTRGCIYRGLPKVLKGMFTSTQDKYTCEGRPLFECFKSSIELSLLVSSNHHEEIEI